MVGFIAVLIYRLIVLGVLAYAVFGLGYSGWWFLLSLVFLGGVSYTVKR